MEKLLKIDDLARLLCLKKQTIYNRLCIGADLPPPIRVGRGLRWQPSTVKSWLKVQQNQFSSS